MDPRRLRRATNSWLATCQSENTKAAYSADFAHFVAWCNARKVDPSALQKTDLARYRAGCEGEGAGAATVARRLSAISSFGASLGKTVELSRPTVASRSNATVLSDEQAEALLSAADEATLRTAVLVRLLMLDGLKVGEAVRADARDVTGRPPRMTLTVQASAPRAVALHPDTAAVVHKYLARRRQGPLVLSEQRGRADARLTRFGVDYLVKQAAEAAGLEQVVSANTLRRRYVMAAHARGTDLDAIRRNAGHADERTTRRYLA